MGRPIDTTQQQLLDAESIEMQSTVELRLLNGEVLRYSTRGVAVDANTFTNDLRKVGEIVQSAFSNVDRTNASLQNADKTIGLRILNGDFDKAVGIVGRFMRDEQDPSKTAHVELFRGEVKPTGITPSDAAIEILDDLVAAGYCVADQSYASECPLVYAEQPRCGADPNLPPCSHNRATCRVLHHFAGMETKIETLDQSPGSDDGGGVLGGGYGGDNGGGRDCFIDGTMVLSATWWRRIIFAVQMFLFGRILIIENLLSKQIETIRAGEKAYAHAADGKLHARRVLNKFETYTSEYVNVWFEGKDKPTGVMPTHRYRIPSGDFAQICKIGVGGEILSRCKGKRIVRRVEKIEFVKLEIPVRRNNLHVEEMLTYIANDDEVHNVKPIEWQV